MDGLTIFQRIADSFVKNMIVEDRYMLILQGLLTTVLITVLASILGTILGGLVCWMKMRGGKVLRKTANVYVNVMRGTPVLVLLMIMYYIILAPVIESAVIVAVITFSMNASAYICEMLRSGIESLDKGQTEAGLILGFNRKQTFFRIVFPQVARKIKPVYYGELISLLKNTSIVGYIAVLDMTKASDLIRSRTFDAFFPLIIVAILYFILAWLIGLLLDFINKKKAKGLIPTFVIIAALIAVLFFENPGVIPSESEDDTQFTSVEQIAERGSVAVMEGSIYDIEYTRLYPDANIERVKNISEAAEYVLSGKATAMVALDVQTKYVMRENPEMMELDSLFTAAMGAGFPKGSPLRDQFNEFLAELKGSEIYDEMIHRWIECDIDTVAMPEMKLPTSGLPLKMAITGTQTPMNTVRGTEYVGFDVELGMRFAEYLNRPLELEVTTFQGLIPDLTMGRVDLAVSDLIYTEERAEKIDFSDIYYDSYASVIILKSTFEGTASEEKDRSWVVLYILLAIILLAILFLYWRKKALQKKVKEYMGDNAGNQKPLEKGDVVISVSHLSKDFENCPAVLKDLNTEIRKGEIISIIGPSGTGKSTFLRCLNLLEKPTEGSIVINGKDILSPYADVPLLRRNMGMVFQSFNLFDGMTVMENITLAPVRLLGRTPRQAEERAVELLRMVGLADKVDAYPDELSGGQKQRIAIARALAMDPEIILFDEPTSALDPTMVSEVLSVIRLLAKEGMTMIVVTHEMRFAREVCNRVFFMSEGHIYEEGSPEQLFDNPQKELTKIFINQIREITYTIDSDVYDYHGMMGAMVTFAEKYNMSYQVIVNLQLAVEESLRIMGTPAGTKIKVTYSEKTQDLRVMVSVPREVPPEQFSSASNSLSNSILHGISSDVDLVDEGKETVLTLTLK